MRGCFGVAGALSGSADIICIRSVTRATCGCGGGPAATALSRRRAAASRLTGPSRRSRPRPWWPSGHLDLAVHHRNRQEHVRPLRRHRDEAGNRHPRQLADVPSGTGSDRRARCRRPGGGPMPPLTVATTLPLSILTDTTYVAGPIGEVTGADQSPTNGAARAGDTVDPVACAAARIGPPARRQIGRGARASAGKGQRKQDGECTASRHGDSLGCAVDDRMAIIRRSARRDGAPFTSLEDGAAAIHDSRPDPTPSPSTSMVTS